MQNLVLFLNHFFDILWWPLSATPCYVDIIIISAISALIFLVIFKKTSNQEMIKRYKNKMIANILEIRLYKDQPVITGRSILNILWCNIIYMRYAIFPLVIILPPLLVISIQINNRYGYAPLEIGKPFIVRADLVGNLAPEIAKAPEKIRCVASENVTIETSPLIIESKASVFWRARVTGLDGNEHYCRISINGTDATVEKKIITSAGIQRFSPERKKWHIRNVFVNNAEDFISNSSPFDAVSVYYNRAVYPFLGWNIDPILLFFILTLIFGLALKPILRVDI